MVIRDNFVDDIGGDGIVPWATDGVLVEHNIARNCNRRASSYNAGIWPWSTDNSLFQLNEAAFTRTTLDGQGFDSDYNSRNTLFQYNYSHDNEGGFMLICTPGKRNQEENVGNIGTVVRYNISRNDRARIFHLSGAEQTTVEDNAIYVGPGLDVQMLLVHGLERLVRPDSRFAATTALRGRRRAVRSRPAARRGRRLHYGGGLGRSERHRRGRQSRGPTARDRLEPSRVRPRQPGRLRRVPEAPPRVDAADIQEAVRESAKMNRRRCTVV